jgi:hypothetical protein
MAFLPRRDCIPVARRLRPAASRAPSLGGQAPAPRQPHPGPRSRPITPRSSGPSPPTVAPRIPSAVAPTSRRSAPAPRRSAAEPWRLRLGSPATALGSSVARPRLPYGGARSCSAVPLRPGRSDRARAPTPASMLAAVSMASPAAAPHGIRILGPAMVLWPSELCQTCPRLSGCAPLARRTPVVVRPGGLRPAAVLPTPCIHAWSFQERGHIVF